MLLLLSLFSPIAELFPNLYMSWWIPDNGKLQAYLKAWKRRVAVVLIVWSPILITLGLITSTMMQLFVALLVFTAFGLRLYSFDNALEQTKGENNDFAEPSKIPEIIYFIAFSTIGWLIYQSTSDNHWLVPVGIILIYFGAFIMSTFRNGANKNFKIDVIGRIIFTFGFLLNLYNLASAALLI